MSADEENANNTQQQHPKSIQWVKSPHGVFDVYANMVHLTWSLDDVRVRLAQLVDAPNAGSPGPGFQSVAEERAAVTFSWRAAKLVRDQLSTIIDNYEKKNGPIKTDLKLPPGLS